MTVLNHQHLSNLLGDQKALRDHICQCLSYQTPYADLVRSAPSSLTQDSAVLLPLSLGKHNHRPCLLLNKRSAKVRQPGDLCFPGGGIGLMDAILAKFQWLPMTHLKRWPKWSNWRARPGNSKTLLARLLTTSLRESYEEMRLNPFKVSFLGPLPVQQLVMFKRTIYPMVGWIDNQNQFKPNWEVERIVPIPLEQFFDESLYGRYRLSWNDNGRHLSSGGDFPCFKVIGNDHFDILWGATYRITMSFLNICFDFKPPRFENLPIFSKHLKDNYFTGA